MSDSHTGNQPEGQGAAPQAENAPQQSQQSQPVPTEISALANYRAARQPGSPPAAPQNPQGGDATPDGSAATQDGREQFIPRQRFDEVNSERQRLAAQLADYQARQLNQGPFQQQQQQVGPTGMVQGQAPVSQQQGPVIPDFNDPKVQREWRDKIANNPVTGLQEFVELAVQKVGAPLIQQITSQLQPLQRAYFNQQVQAYGQSKASDPTWNTVRPFYENLAGQAAQRGVDVTNPQIQSTIEHIARQYAQQAGHQVHAPAPQPMQQPAPFTERPGNSGAGFGQAQPQVQLSAAQRAMAQRFNMTESEYAASLRTFGS